MSLTLKSKTDEFSSSIASCSLASFVDDAKQVLEQGHSVITYKSTSNQKIGELFARAVVDIALPSQIASIEKRYGITLARISEQVKYLRAQDILAFASGILNPSRETFKEKAVSRYSTSDLTQEERKARVAEEHFESAALQKQELEPKIAAIDIKNYTRLITPEALKGLILDQLMQKLSKQTFDLDQLQEVLCKLFGTNALKEGMRIPLPSLKDPSTGQIITNTGFYQVHKKIAKEGLMAFALVPVDAPKFMQPMILFRPTVLTAGEKNALKTIAEDMHDEVGKYGFDAAKQELEHLLIDPSFIQPDQKGWVGGFSLGGAHAARLLAFAPDRFSKGFFFNDPSTETKVAEEFALKLSQSTHTKDNPLEIRIFHNEQDDVTLAGSCHVGYIPQTSPFKKRAADLCQVSYVKIKTQMSEELSQENISSIAQVEPSVKNLLSLAQRTQRQAAIKFALMKKAIHCGIVLSNFQETSSTDAPGAHSPRSAKLIKEQQASLEHLDKSHCPLATRFNQHRLSSHGKVIRAIIKISCRKIAEVKNIFRRCKKMFKKLFVKNKYSCTSLIEEKRQKLQDHVWSFNLADFMTVPQALSPQVGISPLDFQGLVRTILAVPQA